MKPLCALAGSSGAAGFEARFEFEAAGFRVLPVPREIPAGQAGAWAQSRGADILALCLPAGPALDAASGAPDSLPVIDASPAQRQNPGWVYGLPEISEPVQGAARVANPGCFAQGAILLLSAAASLMPPGRAAGFCPQLTGLGGYSAGGKRLAAKAERGQDPAALYAFAQNHRHIPEINRRSRCAPLLSFFPAIGSFRRGMLVAAAIPKDILPCQAQDLLGAYAALRPGARARLADELPLCPALDKPDPGKLEFVVAETDNAFCCACLFDNLGLGSARRMAENAKLMLGLA